MSSTCRDSFDSIILKHLKGPGYKADDEDPIYHCARPLQVQKTYAKYDDPHGAKNLLENPNAREPTTMTTQMNSAKNSDDENSEEDEEEEFEVAAEESFASDEDNNTNNNHTSVNVDFLPIK